MILVLNKDYFDETLLDLEEDVFEAVDQFVPQDSYGYSGGTFKVRIEWVKDENQLELDL